MYGAAIWQSGQGLVTDGTKIYLQTGNGPYNGTTRWGHSFLTLSQSLTVLDSFTPWNRDDLLDLDLGSSGPVILDNNQLIGGGKAGVLYLLNRSDLGGFMQGPGPDIALDRVVHAFNATWRSAPPATCPDEWIFSNIHGAPVVWHDPARGGKASIYVWGEMDRLRSYLIENGPPWVATTPSTREGNSRSSCPPEGCTCYGIYPCGAPTSKSTVSAACGMPGGILSLSASGTIAGTGVVWAALPTSMNAVAASVPGTLRAFDAQDVSRELWNSDMIAADALGRFGKFAAPTIANGKVFVATQSNQVQVYGLKLANRYTP